jgi:hypothetical protein
MLENDHKFMSLDALSMTRTAKVTFCMHASCPAGPHLQGQAQKGTNVVASIAGKNCWCGFSPRQSA